MYLHAQETFYRAIQHIKLPRSSTVVVGLSGGPDSVALTYLARQAFKRVIAVTVDHRLREESRNEAERAGDVVKAIGAEHRVVQLDWRSEEGNRWHRTATRARRLRYAALMQQCRALNVNVLMIGHHANDQIETMLYRLVMGSGVIGLGGMHLATSWAVHPDITIVRPLLCCTKSSLIQLCKEKGLDWVEDPSNQMPISPRNRMRPILEERPEVVPDLVDIMSLCREVKAMTQPSIREAMERLASINCKYGTLSFDTTSYHRLNPYIARSVLSIWLRFIASSGNSISRYGLERLHSLVMNESTVSDTNNGCILIPLSKYGRFMIAKQKPITGQVHKVPIRVGETILWDNRFTVTLFVRVRGREEEGETLSEEELKSQLFYIRNFHVSDHEYVRRGIRKVKGAVLVHYHVRGGLPVVVDDAGNVVLIPYFRVMNHAVGVDCHVTFTPQWTMRQLLNHHYIEDT